jgi:opacity protein-like surface antigen
MMRVLFAGLVVATLLSLAASVSAEVYVAGQVGGAFPFDLKNVEGTGTIEGVEFGNLDLANSLVYGAKLGYFFEDKDWRWIGVEVELFTLNPHVKQQQITATSGTATATALTNGAHVRTIIPAVNLIARYPRGRIQPYAGVGLAFVNANVSDETFSTSDSSPGLNLLAGVRVFMTKELALFGEFKYTYTSFQFDDAGLVGSGIKGVYSVPAFVGGVSWHFR